MQSYTMTVKMHFHASNAPKAREWARNVRRSINQIQTGADVTDFDLRRSLDYRHIEIDFNASTECAPVCKDLQDE